MASATDAVSVADAAGTVFVLRPVVCPTCMTRPGKFLGHRGGAHHRYGLGVETRIMRCESCGLIFPDPFPFPADPQELYGDPDKYFSGHDTESKVDNYRAVLGELARLSGRSRPSLLDVGSGRGEALVAARDVGLTDVVGLELSPRMAEEAERLGVEVRLETIEEHAQRSGRAYDLLLLSAVLEHVHDPDSMIASAAALAEPGTVLYVNVPQEPNLLTMLANRAHRLVGRTTVLNLSPTFPPYHVFGFNRRSLAVLLRKHGFEPIRSLVYADPHVPARAGPKDRTLSFVATQVNRVANVTRTAGNMCVWARKT